MELVGHNLKAHLLFSRKRKPKELEREQPPNPGGNKPSSMELLFMPKAPIISERQVWLNTHSRDITRLSEARCILNLGSGVLPFAVHRMHAGYRAPLTSLKGFYGAYAQM